MDQAGKRLYILSNLLLIAFGYILRINDEPIGNDLLSAGLIGLILYWALSISGEKSQIQSQKLSEMEEQGITHIFNQRLMRDYYKKKREESRGKFDILGFGLNTFIEDNYNQLNDWSNKYNIRILVIDPDSPNCALRDYEEGDPIGKISNDVRDITTKILDLKNPKIKIRWYKAIPVTSIFRLGNTMFIGPYFTKTRSRNSMTIELKVRGLLFDRYANHFDSLWLDPNLSRDPIIEKK